MVTMPPLLAACFWAGLLIVLMVVLSLRVTLGRRRNRVSLGDGDNDQMTVLCRTFANAAEYVPAGMAALILLALVQTPALWIHLIGGGLLLGRLIHPFGMNRPAPNAPRALGMILTWLALIAAAVLLILSSLALV